MIQFLGMSAKRDAWGNPYKTFKVTAFNALDEPTELEVEATSPISACTAARRKGFVRAEYTSPDGMEMASAGPKRPEPCGDVN